MSKSPFAENTQRILDEGIECGNDFVSLVLSGEALRGASAAKEQSPPELAAYDAFVRNYKGEAWDDLEVTMAEVMCEMYAYANQSRWSREWEDGTLLLTDINDNLAMATALVRCGKWEVSRLKALCERTQQAFAAVVCRLGDISQYAEDHTLIYFSDTEWQSEGIFDVYAFWEQLAWLSPSRVALHVAVLSNARRQRIIAQAVANYIANGPKE